jgi:glucosamine kinase
VETGDLAANMLFLGVDGGATKCRARLTDASGAKLGDGAAGPANIRLGLDPSLASILDATNLCLRQAGLSSAVLPRVSACLALAGATEPTDLAAAQATKYPFANTVITSDAQAACIGAHGERDGGVIVVGTGSIGWAQIAGRQHRLGGWGLPISDEGSGAWLGCEVLRRVLWAHDGRMAWTGLLKAAFAQFQSDPHAIVRWTGTARPHDCGSLAPLVVDYAKRFDPVALELMQSAAGHIDTLASRLIELGAQRLALTGGLAPHVKPWLAQQTLAHLVMPAGDALDGALRLARAAVGATQSGHL